MSNSDTRKSMDDVLASIRRIVRAEKEPDDATADAVAEPDAMDGLSEAEVPLELTPDMRMSGADQTESSPMQPQAPEQPAIDPSDLREMVRDVLHEELVNGGADDLIRAVIRDELTKGSTGSNISKNVLRLVRAEIAKATGS